jgi:uncharacterized protein with PQ loop repeat
MFCPRCSQEQVSEDTKFCSRCGFPLGLVSEVLTNGGFLPQLAETNKNKKRLTRKNGLLFSLFWFIFFALMLTPILGGITQEEVVALMCAIIGTMGALILLLVSFAFLKNEPKSAENYNQEISDYKVRNLYGSQQTALPPQQSQPAQNYVLPAHAWKAPDTGEMVQPQSVTEVTTKLLKKEE